MEMFHVIRCSDGAETATGEMPKGIVREYEVVEGVFSLKDFGHWSSLTHTIPATMRL